MNTLRKPLKIVCGREMCKIDLYICFSIVLLSNLLDCNITHSLVLWDLLTTVIKKYLLHKSTGTYFNIKSPFNKARTCPLYFFQFPLIREGPILHIRLMAKEDKNILSRGPYNIFFCNYLNDILTSHAALTIFVVIYAPFKKGR